MLAYIAGDNNLSDAGLEDIDEMCHEGASSKVHVGVEIDTYGEHTGSIRYEITEPDWTGHAHRTVIQRLGEKDTGDPRTLRDFLRWGLKRYPSNFVTAVIWNHGSGFRSIRRDIGYDDFGTSLDMPEIELAFRAAGIGLNRRISVLGFDACLMNMLEIAHHFRGQVDFLVGSQQTEPGDGWPYDRVLKAIKNAVSPDVLAKLIVQVYMKSYRDIGVTDVTQSAIDIAKTDPAAKALGEFGRVLAAHMNVHRQTLRNLRMSAQMFEMADYVDLIHIATSIAATIPDSAIRAAAAKVMQATRACILFADANGASVRNANGLSVWFPAAAQLYSSYRGKYMQLKCSQQYPGWVRFLDAYHA